MALFVRDDRIAGSRRAYVEQWIHVARATATVPATATESIYTISGGRIWVHLLMGEVTTLIQTQADNLSVVINPTTGTSGTVGADLDITADEVGTLYFVEGDGTAIIGVNAGTGWPVGTNSGFVVPIGTLDIVTSATNTGAIKWDLFYQPLDEGAFVVTA